ncbi:mucin-2-like [Anastrepha ludens]|uniref:mucin-2-like n=1 Tax=Anastrepha ludens TaxID=28586 RepID=UPI0023B19646|nr:mucin-2-like [Anastrepha ludens]
MLSSTKFTALLLLLLVAALSTRSAAFQLREAYETTTVTADEELALTPTPTPTTTKTTKKAVQSSAPTQQQIADYAKSVKIFFPSNDNSEEESKFDIYGLKTTPPPNGNKIQTGYKLHTTTEATVIETTTTSAIAFKAGNSTSNATLTSVDNRLGILNLAPHCPEGHVIVNQRCHKSA